MGVTQKGAAARTRAVAVGSVAVAEMRAPASVVTGNVTSIRSRFRTRPSSPGLSRIDLTLEELAREIRAGGAHEKVEVEDRRDRAVELAQDPRAPVRLGPVLDRLEEREVLEKVVCSGAVGVAGVVRRDARTSSALSRSMPRPACRSGAVRIDPIPADRDAPARSQTRRRRLFRNWPPPCEGDEVGFARAGSADEDVGVGYVATDTWMPARPLPRSSAPVGSVPMKLPWIV